MVLGAIKLRDRCPLSELKHLLVQPDPPLESGTQEKTEQRSEKVVRK